MRYFTFLFYEFLLFAAAIVVSYFSDSYLNPPFTSVDVIASVIFLPILGFIFYLLIQLFKRFDSISMKKKVLLSIPVFFMSVFVTSVIMAELFGVH